MNPLMTRLGYLLGFLARGEFRRVWKPIRERVYSDGVFLCLRRDLAVPFDAPPARIPLEVRPAASEDDLSFLVPDAPGMTSRDLSTRLVQLYLRDAAVKTCYVAVPAGDASDGPRPVCYMQWLIPSSENEKLRRLFGPLALPLQADEAMLEGAYTGEAYRGQGIMASAMAEIASRAAAFGARWVITFVNEGNIASLKGCKKAGFAPYLIRHEKFRLFRRTVRFTPLPQGTPYPFDAEKSPAGVPAAVEA